MKKKIFVLVSNMILVMVFTACSGMMQTVEVTRLVPKTVEVTKIVNQTVIVTEFVERTSVPPQRTPIAFEIRAEPDQETAYYEGIIVLAEYYTLLDQGLFEQAYLLLSQSRPNAKSLEEYLADRELVNIYAYRLISAQPYYEWSEKQGGKASPDPKNRKRFYIRVFAEGEGGMAGSVTNGIHTFFAKLVWENGEWKIYSINTSP